jgi:hypothetical protein
MKTVDFEITVTLRVREFMVEDNPLDVAERKEKRIWDHHSRTGGYPAVIEIGGTVVATGDLMETKVEVVGEYEEDEDEP